MQNFYVVKRISIPKARMWLFDEHDNDLQRYLDYFYYSEDQDYISAFFHDNPIQAMQIVQDFCENNERKQDMIVEEIRDGKSKIIYLVGGRGSGKTATAFYLAERLKEDSEIFYIIPDRPKALPTWCRTEEDIKNTPIGSINIVDEAAIQFAARESWKEQNILLSKMMAISRHQNKTLIFLTQHTHLIDVNIRRLRDIILWKQQADYVLSEGKFISKEQQFWQMIRSFMKPKTVEQVLFEYPMRRRFVMFEHPLPECWSELLSKSWRNIDWSKYEKPAKKKRKIDTEEEDYIIIR